MKVIILLLASLLSSCHVYHYGYLINRTSDTIQIVTKPSLLAFWKDERYEKLKEQNVESNDSVFRCFIKANDSLKFNWAASYSSSLQHINLLEIRNRSDTLLFPSKKSIMENVKLLKRRVNHIHIGIIITDSLLKKANGK